MRDYINLLSDNLLFRRLSLMQLIGYFGAWFSNVAIYTLLINLEVSGWIIAVTAALHFLPGVIQAPLTGVLIDKFQPKKLMALLLIVEIVTTLGLIAIEHNSEVWLLLILVFLRMSAASFYFTLEMTLLPNIVDKNQLQRANELHSIIWSFSYSAGMAVSALLVYFLGTTLSFMIDAFLFVVVLLLLVNLSIPAVKKSKESRYIKLFIEGFSYLKREKGVLSLVLLHSAVGISTFDALVALLVKERFSSLIGVALAIGFIHAVRALALIVGPIWLKEFSKKKSMALLFAFQGVALIVWSTSFENFYLTLFISFFTGLAMTTLWSLTYTLIQINTDKSYLGRVTSYNDMFFLLVATLTSLFIGRMAQMLVSLEVITAILGALYLTVAIYAHHVNKNYTIKEAE